MSTVTTVKKPRQTPVRSRVRKPKTIEAFLQWEQPEGYYKYEWVDGTLEKTEYMMKNTERLIVHKINRALTQSDFYQNGGDLFAETAVPVSGTRVRIPDISFFTKEQIVDSAKGGQPVPSFAIEIISPSESGFKIEQEVFDYFEAGVQVLWQIYPNLRMVKILTSPQEVQVCLKQEVCSAAPAIPDLQLTVEELFGEGGASSQMKKEE